MNTTEERIQILEKNIQNQSLEILNLKLKHKGVQPRVLIEERLREAEKKRDRSMKNADWFTWTGATNALKWVLSAEVEEEVQLQRASTYNTEHRIKK